MPPLESKPFRTISSQKNSVTPKPITRRRAGFRELDRHHNTHQKDVSRPTEDAGIVDCSHGVMVPLDLLKLRDFQRWVSHQWCVLISQKGACTLIQHGLQAFLMKGINQGATPCQRVTVNLDISLRWYWKLEHHLEFFLYFYLHDLRCPYILINQEASL